MACIHHHQLLGSSWHVATCNLLRNDASWAWLSTVSWVLTTTSLTSSGHATNTSVHFARSTRSLTATRRTPLHAWSCFSRLDYCNAILYSISEYNISRLQHLQNSLARVVCQAPYRSSAIHLCRALHWLPVRQCIEYKVASLTFKVRLHHQPIYLPELVVDHVPNRSLCFSDKVLLVVPRTKTVTASRAFHVTAPKTWHSLPLESDPLLPLAYFINCSQYICSIVHITNWSPQGASVAVPRRMLDTRKCTDLWRWLTTCIVVLYCIFLSFSPDMLARSALQSSSLEPTMAQATTFTV